MKRPASTRSLLTVPFAIPAYWTPDQALAVVELLDGLRELIWARYGLQLLDERRAKLQPFADSLFTPRRSKKRSTSRTDGSLPANAKSAMSATTIYHSDHFNLIDPPDQGPLPRHSPEWPWLCLQTSARAGLGRRGTSPH